MTTRFMVVVLVVAMGCSAEARVDGKRDYDSGSDEDRWLDERLPDLIDQDSGADSDVVDTDAAIEESEPDAAVGVDAEVDSGADAEPSPVDSDGDGVLDEDDVCEGHDDALNYDRDSYPDACDSCPIHASDDWCHQLIWSITAPEEQLPAVSGDTYYTRLRMLAGEEEAFVSADLPSTSGVVTVDASGLDSVRAMFAAGAPKVSARVQFTTEFGTTYESDSGSGSTDFDPSLAFIERVEVIGFAEAGGRVSAEWRFIGYVRID